MPPTANEQLVQAYFRMVEQDDYAGESKNSYGCMAEPSGEKHLMAPTENEQLIQAYFRMVA
jgi:hypothetical protein